MVALKDVADVVAVEKVVAEAVVVRGGSEVVVWVKEKMENSECFYRTKMINGHPFQVVL